MDYDQSWDSCDTFVNSIPSPEVGVVSINFTSNQVLSIKQTMRNYCGRLFTATHDSALEDSYSEPMVWIGVYIAVASLFCILAMAADLWNGFRFRKFWFPCKYFSLNAVSITVMTVAMKLSMDLNTRMTYEVDQLTKLGSLPFMCVMIANLMPSLASMDNKELPSNVIGLVILIITVIVNTIMAIITGNINHRILAPISIVYMGMLLFLLLVLISVAISVPNSKQILEPKYQAIKKTSLDDQYVVLDRFIIERLRQHVTKYGIMVQTGSPQFVMASNVLSSASGIICLICVIGQVIFILVVQQIFQYPADQNLFKYGSQYKWSTSAIFITQFIGVLVGSIAPIFRCTTVASYKSFARWSGKYFVVFKVEKYWTQKLYEWKESHITIFSGSRRSRSVFRNLKRFILSIWIGIQKAIVVACKMISLIPTLILLLITWCSNNLTHFLKGMLSVMVSSNYNTNEDLSRYVLLLEDNMELAEKRVERISHFVNRVIQRAEKKQHNDLLKLLEKSTGFEGVSKFDIFAVEPPLPIVLPNSWSLPIATLTCIAISLPSIESDISDNLFKSVGEGLSYTHLVDESLNNVCRYVKVQKAAMILWDEVEDKCKWLGNTLDKSAFEGKKTTEILEWFVRKAEEIVNEVYHSYNGEPNEELPPKLIIANSMKRIAQTIICTYNISRITERQLFELLSRMIADILVACFTNLPQVITMKCHESAIEKRETSVEVAAKLLGRTTKIIEKLATHELPSIDPDKLAFIDEWRLHLQHIP
ncbi:hypothetical protein LXL04_016834 [Taraxacum kok-saghyz]